MSLPFRPLPALLILAIPGCELVERTVIDDGPSRRSGRGGFSGAGQDELGGVQPGGDPGGGDEGADTALPDDTGGGGGGTGGSGGAGGSGEPLGYGGVVWLEEYTAACGACFADDTGYRVVAHARFDEPTEAPRMPGAPSTDTCVDMGAGAWSEQNGLAVGLDAGGAIVLDAGDGRTLELDEYTADAGGSVYYADGGPDSRIGPGRTVDVRVGGGADVGAGEVAGVVSTQAHLTDISPSMLLASDPQEAFGALHPGATITWSPVARADWIEVAIFIYEPSGAYPLDHVVLCTSPDDGSLALPESTFDPFEGHLAAVQIARVSTFERTASWEDVVVQGIAVSSSVGTATIDSACGVGAPCPPPAVWATPPRLRLPDGAHPATRWARPVSVTGP